MEWRTSWDIKDGAIWQPLGWGEIVALTEIDRELVSRCLRRDPGGWREFVDRFLPLFAHVIHHSSQARSVPLQPSDVEDLCADVLITITENDFAVLRRFRGKASLAAYLVVVARRVVVREMIKRRMSEAFGHVRSNMAGVNGAAEGVEPVAPIEARRIEHQETVAKILNGLPRRDAEVVRQYHIEGRSYREISEQLGMPLNSIGPILSRAIERLRGNPVTT